MNDTELRMRCLELAGQQVGPWIAGTFNDHLTTLLTAARLGEAFGLLGYEAAMRGLDKVSVRPNVPK